ncbi:hypothetical protein H0E87_025505 [Populus deltoides]|uniref:Phytocyanin domain-containing protein n=1 Tax=Populus deltoides TaxID=3696 RepID=A0A8T2X0K1_POPDE|nr:hypothetical protein H0E87_025505 [Populus deltoides]
MSTPKQKSLFLAVIFTSLRYLSVYSFEYQIGGNENWVVPPAIDIRIYVDWALGNRFQVGDTFSFNFLGVHLFLRRFQVKEGFRHEASSYFISGVSGHCEKGQRMIIIRVISTDQETNSSLQLFLLQEC